jgi:hypothetical protein
MQQTTAKEAALNLFAILGFIALLIAGLWATIQLMQVVFSFVGNTSSGLFAKSSAPLASLSLPSIQMQVRDSIVSPQKPFAIGWVGKNIADGGANGTLTFTYACRAGLFLKVQASTDTEYAIPCNVAYTIPKEASALSVTPILSVAQKIEVPVTLSYAEAGRTTKDTAVITIDGATRAPFPTPASVLHPEPVKPVALPIPQPQPTPKPIAKPQPVAKPEPTPTPQPAPKPAPVVVEKPVQKSDVNGFVDLEARIITIGKLANTGVVSPRASFTTNETASITFEVINVGTKAVKNWHYSLALPTAPAYTHNSEAQPTLYAGSKATVTISFDKLAAGTPTIVLTADPANKVVESTRANNVARAAISVR